MLQVSPVMFDPCSCCGTFWEILRDSQGGTHLSKSQPGHLQHLRAAEGAQELRETHGDPARSQAGMGTVEVGEVCVAHPTRCQAPSRAPRVSLAGLFCQSHHDLHPLSLPENPLCQEVAPGLGGGAVPVPITHP